MSKKLRTLDSNGLSRFVKDVKPRRNYWGNLNDDDTFDENDNVFEPEDYDYSDYDEEDDHDSFYSKLY